MPDFNFLSSAKRTHPAGGGVNMLLGAIVASFSVSALLGGIMLSQSGNRTANISETLDTPSPSPTSVGYPVSGHVPQLVGAAPKIAPATSAVRGNSKAILVETPDATELRLSDSDGKDSRVIMRTRASELALSWPQNDYLALSSLHAIGPGRDLTLISMDGALIPLLSDMANLEYVWSPDGSKLLYSYFEKDKGIQLWKMEVFNHIQTPLGLATAARKCAWHPDMISVTCGIPTNTALSRDVPSAQSATHDDIITLNTLTGEHQVVLSQNNALGIIDPEISSSGSSFLFTNLFDQKRYSLEF